MTTIIQNNQAEILEKISEQLKDIHNELRIIKVRLVDGSKGE